MNTGKLSNDNSFLQDKKLIVMLFFFQWSGVNLIAMYLEMPFLFQIYRWNTAKIAMIIIFIPCEIFTIGIQWKYLKLVSAKTVDNVEGVLSLTTQTISFVIQF